MNNNSHMILVQTHKDLAPFTSGVLFEIAAAKYVKIDIEDFRKMVKAGEIIARRRPGRKHLIYLKEDLDNYLRNIPVARFDGSTISSGEAPLKPPSLKEALSGS